MLREESHYRLSLTYLKNKFLPLSPWYRERNFLHISIIIIRGVPSCSSCLFISLQYLVVSRMHIFSLIFLSCRFCFTRCILKTQSLLLFHAQKVSELYHCKLQLPAPTAKAAPAYTSSPELLVIPQKQHPPTPHPLICQWSLNGNMAGLWPNLSRKVGDVWIKMKAFRKSVCFYRAIHASKI